jgi:hypothetical protein
MPSWKEELERLLPPDVDFENDPDYPSTAEAARLRGTDPKSLWRLVEKGRLSKPVCLSARRCYWARKELEALRGKTVPPEDDFVRSRAQAVKRLRTVDQDRRRRVDHPLGCDDAAPSLEARSAA